MVKLFPIPHIFAYLGHMHMQARGGSIRALKGVCRGDSRADNSDLNFLLAFMCLYFTDAAAMTRYFVGFPTKNTARTEKNDLQVVNMTFD